MIDPSPQEVEILAEASRLLTSTLDLTEVLDRLAQIAHRRLETDVARIWLLDDSGEVLRLAAHRGRIRAPLPAREHVATRSSLVGWVLAHRKPLSLTDVQQDPRLEKRAWFKAEGFVSLLCVPILLDDAVSGILSCMTRERREFTAAEMALAEALTASAALAIRNARLYSDTVRRLAEIEAFQRVAADTLASPDLTTVLEAVVREIPRLLHVDGAACLRLEPATGALALAADAGTRVRRVTALRLEPGERPATVLVADKRPLRSDDWQEDPRFGETAAFAGWARDEGIVSLLAVPVTDAGGEAIAALCAFHRSPRPFDGGDEATLTGLGRQAALAMDNARLVGDLRRTLDELQAAQDTLVRGATLRAVGELAAGAAHHLNNLMAVVLGRTQLLLYRNRDPENGPALRTIERAALDAADTVRRIQAFSRAGHGASAAPLDLNATVRESIDLTRSRWEHEAQVRGAKIELTFEPGTLPSVSGRNSELREVITNLILNAVDAMPQGGRLTIRTWGEPGRAVVSVADSGPGMPEDVRGRAFEPFFTTKGVRRLGLGLAVAYGLVSGHGGDIALDSSEGRGTTVVFWVPATTVVETPAPAASGDGERHGRILVVDDEADVREVLADVLHAQGHSVTLAGGGQEALACLERDPFDLVITDLGMPDVNGWDVARAVKAGREGLPVLLLTGWSDAVESGVGRVDAVIKKPFDMTKLAAAVNAALKSEA